MMKTRDLMFLVLGVMCVAACGDDEDGGKSAAADTPETCTLPTDCGEADACSAPLCVDGQCERFYAPEGSTSEDQEQEPGDCARKQCDGDGNLVTVEDDTDLPDDDDPCTLDLCTNGPTNPFSDLGTACGEEDTFVCDGAGECVECLSGADCGSGVCNPDQTCLPGEGPRGPSCDAGLECLAGTSCCHSVLLPSEPFLMGTSIDGTDAHPNPNGPGSDMPEHPAQVDLTYLDTFEVTVGRFRVFVDDYEQWRASGHPMEGEGTHPAIANSGWREAWSADLPSSREEMVNLLTRCDSRRASWTDEPGDQENRAINCISWTMAMAFCTWDGGRLPTEAEWELAAAGGAENRKYPWGSEIPRNGIANVNGRVPANVGSNPQGVARWGNHDMAGNVREWVLDWYDHTWYSNDGADCDNCANIDDNSSSGRRVHRGGGWWNSNPEYSIRVTLRGFESPDHRRNDSGFRCARSPQP